MRDNSERHWLDLAEYASLAGSVAGSLAAVASHQVVYATTPLTLALSLNLANRQRFQQQLQQQATNRIADIHQEVRFLHNKVQVLPPTERINDLETTVHKLEQTIALDIRQKLDTLVQAFKNRPELEKINELNQALAPLCQSLEQLPPPTKPFDPTPLLHEIEKLEQSIANLQENATTTIAKVCQEFSSEIEFVHTSIQSRLEPLEAIDHNQSAQALVQVQTDLQALEHNIALHLSSLQTQIDQNRQLHKELLPPFDSSCLEQRLTVLELLKSTIETDLLHLFESVEHLQSGAAPIESAIAQIRNQLSDLASRFDNRPEPQQLEQLREAQAKVQQALSQLPKPFDPSHLITQIESLGGRIDNLPLTALQQQLAELREIFESLDESAAELHDRTRNLDQMLHLTTELAQRTTRLESHTQNFEQIQQQLDNWLGESAQAEDFDNAIAKLSEEVAGQINTAVEQQVTGINRLLKEIQPKYEYKLVIDRDESREVLLESLQQAQEHLILVCPWLTEYVINAEVIQKFRAILKRNGQIDIGWGHLSDTKLDQPKHMSRQEFLTLVRHKARKLPNQELWNYQALRSLEQLEQEYPKQFRLKLLGTHEKFLVCDRLWTMLGSHNFLTSGDKSEEREVGLWTDDPYIVDQLIKRFEDADNLEKPSGIVYLAS